MRALKTAIGIVWLLFWLYWLVSAAFPEQYPAYRSGTKMLIPFVL